MDVLDGQLQGLQSSDLRADRASTQVASSTWVFVPKRQTQRHQDQGLLWLQRRSPGTAKSLQRIQNAFAKSAALAVVVEPLGCLVVVCSGWEHEVYISVLCVFWGLQS